jgi:hypothetical protein
VAGAVARPAFLDQVWTFVVGLFDGRSRTVSEVATRTGDGRAKVEEVYRLAKLGTAQLTLDGKLDPDPDPPVVRDGPCFVTGPDGRLTTGTCQQLQVASGNTALLGTSYGATPIVAAGAGNIVAAGAGNIVAAGAGNIVAAGAGNIVAAGAGNIVAAGAGNIVAAGGGNAISIAPAQIVAAGAGNIVAAGAGNLVAPRALP